MTKGIIKQVNEENKEPVIILAGSNLRDAGFEVGDIVSVSFFSGKIIIAKNKSTANLQDMEQKNPSIKKLIQEFDLHLLVG